MDVNDNAGHLIPSGAWATIAGKLGSYRRSRVHLTLA